MSYDQYFLHNLLDMCYMDHTNYKRDSSVHCSVSLTKKAIVD